MSKRNIIIFAAIFGLIVLGIGAGTAFYLYQQQTSKRDIPEIMTFGPGGRFAGAKFDRLEGDAPDIDFGFARGQIVALNQADFVVDSGDSQTLVGWNDKTQVRKNITASKDEVIKVGNSVLIRYEDENGTFKASSVALNSEEEFVMVAPFRGGSLEGKGPEGGETGPESGQQQVFIQGNPGDRMANKGELAQILIGKIEKIDGDKITIIGLDGNTRNEIDVSAAIYTATEVLTVTDLKFGATVQVSGGRNGDRVEARVVTVEQ